MRWLKQIIFLIYEEKITKETLNLLRYYPIKKKEEEIVAIQKIL